MKKLTYIILLVCMAIVLTSGIAARCRTFAVRPICAAVVGQECPVRTIKICLPIRR